MAGLTVTLGVLSVKDVDVDTWAGELRQTPASARRIPAVLSTAEVPKPRVAPRATLRR